ncbi:YIP1 family protein [Lutimaribacter sp. EGI FJ00015]|uniref:YIP1 family protein n=1 Tax=Lutimaribacter degradans TaxID=2945989 RepID=A0ACC5ZWT3_9RHOB|nr:YIP1 family protein [Lutimaribacter sp. EGI FJ00013]MCM2562221.1 YIP1 family protein [Lutimaribacter sp. EGI FJ00013]MCO0613376.1 YIP1 family protein [Lutimaribacter sp. EGI FJ00015]MCO0636350.1 YIP1 family protein [Lutimaribacter sp. EGI FJ00014]
MALMRDITATYRGPGRVVGRLLAAPTNEGRALALVMGACVVLFIARWPALARQAHLQDEDLQMLLGSTLFATVFMLPLLFYVLGLVAHLLARGLGGKGTAYGARIALFWALLASSPLVLLNGLVAGFIGPGIQLTIVGILWTAVFLWFWIAGMRRVGWG